jgi:hypothetical protein
LTSLSMDETYESVMLTTARRRRIRVLQVPQALSIHALTFQCIPSTLGDIAASHSTHLYLATSGQYNFPSPIPAPPPSLRPSFFLFLMVCPSQVLESLCTAACADGASRWLGHVLNLGECHPNSMSMYCLFNTARRRSGCAAKWHEPRCLSAIADHFRGLCMDANVSSCG